MSHLVEKMFSVREAPWHYSMTGPDKTLIVDEYPTTWAEARSLAGLDWDPIEEAPFRRDVVINPESGEPEHTYTQVPGFKWIARSDTGLILDSSRDSFELITNSDMGDIIDTFMNGHKIEFVTGGCLDEGRKVWALMKMGDLIEVKGDPSPIARYVALLNAHDGHGACKAIATNVRIVCANTWHLADTQSDADLTCFSFHHRANWRQHMDSLQADVQAALSGADKELKAFQELADDLIVKTVTDEQAERFIQEWSYPTKEEHRLKPQALKNVERKREQTRAIYFSSKTTEGIRGTAWGLVQAAGEYLDHDRKKKSQETLLGRTIFSSEELKVRARTFAELASQGVL